jgi:energy-converting hydrogenase Eha subunit G
MGFVPIPLLCLVVRIVGRDVYPSLDMAHPSSWLLVLLIWLACCATKVLTSMTLLGYACNQVC